MSEVIRLRSMGSAACGRKWNETRRRRSLPLTSEAASYLSGFQFTKIAYLAQFDPHALELGVVGCLVNIAIFYSVAKPIEGIGIAMPALLSPLVATALALLLAPEAAPPLAFVISVVGPLIGADLLHLREVEAAQTGMASIGGPAPSTALSSQELSQPISHEGPQRTRRTQRRMDYPLTQISGRRRATLRASPARSAATTTAPTSL